jgi:hypothetical protein
MLFRTVSISLFILVTSVASGWPQNQPKLGAYPTWKTFTSQGGWEIKYPTNVHISSCRNCTDVHDPDNFVSFFAPGTDGLMMVYPLIGKPDQWTDDD